MKDEFDNETGELVMDEYDGFISERIVLPSDHFDRFAEMIDADPSENQKAAIDRLLSRERRWGDDMTGGGHHE